MNRIEIALQLIKEFEGLELTVYPDPATGSAPWTVGYGSTVWPDGRSVAPGDTVTAEQATEMLRHHVERRCIPALDAVHVPLTENEAGALLSFIYNVGAGAFKSSTLLRLLNDGVPKAEVAEQFARWDKANGKKLRGLARRRAAERELFLKIG